MAGQTGFTVQEFSLIVYHSSDSFVGDVLRVAKAEDPKPRGTTAGVRFG